MAAARHPINGKRLSQDEYDRLTDPTTGDWDWDKLGRGDQYHDSSSWMGKEQYAAVMREIRGRYAKHLKAGMHDGAAFDSVVDHYEQLWQERPQALRFATKALVVGSAKAKLINVKYYRGRYK